MRQILLNGNGAVVARVPRPILLPGTVLVRVHYSLISVGTEIAPLRSMLTATDITPAEKSIAYASLAKRYLRASIKDPQKAAARLKQIAGRQLSRLRPPAPPADPASTEAPVRSELDDQGWNVGYSAAGEVLAVAPDITDLVPGDLVACAGAGQANHADYIVVKRNLVARLPKGCPVEAAAATTIGAIALQGVRRAAPTLGERVAVVGLGLIGQITVQLLKANGCTVLGLDLDPARVERARSLGLDAGASDADQFRQIVRDLTAGHGADRTLLTAATRSDVVINLAMEVTRRRGTVVIVGDVSLNVQREVFYRKEIDLLMSTSYGPGRYDPSYEIEGRDYPYGYVRWTQNRNMQAFLELVSSGAVRIEPLIDRVITVDEAPATYKELAKGGQALPMGILIRYPDDVRALPDAPDATKISIQGHRSPIDGTINYALVGAGSFGTAMLVPQMKKRRDRFFLRGVVSRGSSQAGNFARENQVEVLTSDYDAVLADARFQLVVIATRHDLHADQVARAIRAGKHVFVEKPLAISWQSLDAVASAYRAASNPPLVLVGFNRRFSPGVEAIANATRARRAPLVVNYRLHAGYLPPDHWVHGPEGGGRNVGEACHMYDVFRFLAGAPVSSVSATSIDPGSLPYFRNDNFTASIQYADGSLCTLTYTSLGPKSGMGKEYLEVFCDGEAYVLDDFRKVTKASDGSILWQSGDTDKGHREELSRFGDAIASGGGSPIPFEELVETTAVSLHVEDLLHGRVDADA